LIKDDKKIKEINALWNSFQKSHDEKIREKLLINYLSLVKIIAGRMKVTLPGSVEYNDLVSSGLIGLINSIDNFNPKRGFKVETYAAPRIRGAILDGLRDVDWLPRSYRQKSRKLDQTMEKLFSRLGRIPTDEEIAKELELNLDDYYKYIDHVGAASLVSLDIHVAGTEGDSGSLYEVISDDNQPNPYDLVEEADIQQAALNLIDELSDQERTVVALYYYEGLTFREIGEVIGVSESRVCQIHTKIISILRVRLRKLLE
jgi:RNA polymerase sigma factor for flagellar operon FliA